MSTNESHQEETDVDLSASRAEAFQLLADVVAQNSDGRDLTASQARLQMKRKSYGGFNPKDLGFARFRDFLSEAAKEGYVVVDDTRPGDYTLSPPTRPSGGAGQTARIRPDLWRAFLDWSHDLQRVYDIERDQATMLPVEPAPLEPQKFRELRLRLQENPAAFVTIEPIDMQTQLGWMREFADKVSDLRLKSLLRSSLASDKPAKLFSAVLREIPDKQLNWRNTQRARVRSFIEEWRDSAPTVQPIRIDTDREMAVRDTSSTEKARTALHTRADVGDLLSLVNDLAIATKTARTGTYTSITGSSVLSQAKGSVADLNSLRTLLHAAIDRMSLEELKDISIPIGYLFED